MRKRASLLPAVVVVALCSSQLPGQTPPAPKPAPTNANTKSNQKGLEDAVRGSPWGWDVQTIINEYVRLLSQNYGLTEKQEEYTRELMSQRVKQFLKDYEKDARTLVSEYMEYRMRGEMPTAEAAKDFARRAAPLIPAIRQEIMDGNMQWRRILNEEQLKKHDQDLDLMRQSFDVMEQSMQRWSEGKVQPTDVGIRDRNRPMNITKVEDSMGIYVKNFIAQYNLDEGQRQTAYSILREAREEATRYRDSHKEEFAEMEAKQKELAASNPTGEENVKRAKEEGRKLTERRAELEKPLNEELFARFKERLDSIPTANQKAAYQARQNALKERLAKLRNRATGTTLPAETRPAAEASTQPAK